MCGGYPCNCCKAKSQLDNHFDANKPWKCFFKERDTVEPFPNPAGMTNSQLSSAGLSGDTGWWWFVNRYQHPTARPLPGTCVDSKYELPVPGNGNNDRPYHLMSRMKYAHHETWEEQRITLTVDYEFPTDPYWEFPVVSGTGQRIPGSRIEIAIGDEHDDSAETYPNAYFGAFPLLRFRLWANLNTPSTPNFIFNATSYRSDLSFAGSISGRKYNGGVFSPTAFFNLTQAGTIVFQFELLETETKVSAVVNGDDAGWHFGTAAPQLWWTIPEKLFRESPRFRVGVGGSQYYSDSSRNPDFARRYNPMKLDRIRCDVESV